MSIQDSTTNNLLFLLAAAPLGLGCIIVSDDDGETTAAGTGNPTTAGQTTEGTTGNDTTPPATGDGTGSTSSGAESSDGADSTGADSTGADSTGGATADCGAYGAHAIECALPYARYAESYCTYTLEYQEMYSAECGIAYEELVVCLSALSCEDLMGAEPCPDALAALLALGCPAVE